MKVYGIWCEWDIGEDGNLYDSKEVAKNAMADNINVQEICIENECTLEDLFLDGLIGYTEYGVYGT